jgi:phenylacetate-CoA ligase
VRYADTGRGTRIVATPTGWALGRSARRLVPPGLKQPLRRIYRRLPYWWRAGETLRTTYAFLKESEFWDRDRLREYQRRRLVELIRHVSANVPAYRTALTLLRTDPSDIASVDSIRRFPALTKEALRHSPEDFIAEDIPEDRLQYVMSGGTTGKPTGFYHIRTYNDEVATAYRLMMWGRAGYRPGDRVLDITASFDGDPLQYAPESRTLYLSISALGHRDFKAAAEAVRSFRPEFILGFPSTATLLAQLSRNHDTPLDTIRAVITSSEVMHEPQRRYICDAFGCRILSWYGMAEYAGFASGCEHSDEYHFFPQAGILEILDDDGRPVTDEGGEGEIVLTGFHNLATPFIRYRTGDRGVVGAAGCARCGRNYPIVKLISGRTQEYLVAGGGRLIPNSALNVHSDAFDDVRAYQFYQDTPGKVRLDVVKNASCGSDRLRHIRETMLEKMGPGMDLEIRIVEDIPRTPRGKHRFIVQKLAIGEEGAGASMHGGSPGTDPARAYGAGGEGAIAPAAKGERR